MLQIHPLNDYFLQNRKFSIVVVVSVRHFVATLFREARRPGESKACCCCGESNGWGRPRPPRRTVRQEATEGVSPRYPGLDTSRLVYSEFGVILEYCDNRLQHTFRFAGVQVNTLCGVRACFLRSHTSAEQRSSPKWKELQN